MKGKRAATWIAGALLVAALGTWSVRGFHNKAELRVSTAPVSAGPIVRRIVAIGTLEAVTTVQVGAQVSGIIQSLGADYNSIVHPGQVIARLDPALFEAALEQAKAAEGQAEANEKAAEANLAGFAAAVEDAQMKLTRAETLAAKQLIPQSDLDAAHIAFDGAIADRAAGAAQIVDAKASIGQAKAAVQQAQINLDRTVITSPIEGIVIARNVDVGQTVASAFQAPVLFNIAADLQNMQVEVDIDESDIGGIKPGEAVKFGVESYPNDAFEGTVSAVRLQPIAEQTTTAATNATVSASPGTLAAGSVVGYATIINVANPGERLRPGMTATVTLDGSRVENAVRIPNNALSFRPPVDLLRAGSVAGAPAAAADPGAASNVARVWRYAGTQFTPVDVRVGLADGQWTELVSGPVRPGDVLVTNVAR